MTPEKRQQLCLDLMHADTEQQVIDLLSAAGYWTNDTAWRSLGGHKYNFATVGSQQSLAEQAIVEKLVNSIDAKLIAEARIRGYLPKTGSTPTRVDIPDSIQEARQRFFGAELEKPEYLSRSITIAATAPGTPRRGYSRPCFTIVDDGEGQTPKRMPHTILSLLEGNKDKIRFVQGKFNMGGTGVLEFCGRDRNLQLIVSRRHPELIDRQSRVSSDDDWSFTVIRRNDPTDGKSSSYVYLAPLGYEDSDDDGDLLHFFADSLPLFPNKSDPYQRHTAWGTLIKLYEYDAVGFRSNMLQSDGLMSRTRILLPEPALPIRFHECRPFRGRAGSFDTTMNGLIYTLESDIDSDRRDNVEWHDELEFYVNDERFRVKLFVFRDKNTTDGYRRDEGVVFSYNGQCHAALSKDFFRRRRVKKDYLWQSLLVIVDCSDISPRSHERLFMNGRDRLRRNQFRVRVEEELEDQIREHEELKGIQEHRRKRETATNRESSDNLAKALENILTTNKTLAAILGEGTRVRNPHRPEDAGGGVVGFIGKRFPTKFHLKGRDPDKVYVRDAYMGSKVRLIFDTDAANDYFRRQSEPGEFGLYAWSSDDWKRVSNYSRPTLLNGWARMALEIPEGTEVGEQVALLVEVTDPSRIEPFSQRLTLKVCGERQWRSGSRGNGNSGGDDEGAEKGGGGGSGKQTKDNRVGMPEPHLVVESEWGKHDPPFDKFTAVRVKRHPDAAEGEERYDYYVNMGNGYLRRYAKENSKRSVEIERRFAVGMTLVALSVVHYSQIKVRRKQTEEGQSADGDDLYLRVEQTTSALAPFLLPIVESLREIGDGGESYASDNAGEAA